MPMPDQGCAWHWTVNTPPPEHALCEATWRGIASAHYARGSSGYTLYNWGVCDHGIALKGRGWDRQSGANGTGASNSGWWAIVWIGGPGHVPSAAAIATMRRLTTEAPGAKRAVPHFTFTSTACPGPDVAAAARAYTPDAVPVSVDEAVRLTEEDMALVIQITKGKKVTGHVLADNDWTFGIDADYALAEHGRGTPFVKMPESEYKRFVTAYVFKDPEKVRPAQF